MHKTFSIGDQVFIVGPEQTSLCAVVQPGAPLPYYFVKMKLSGRRDIALADNMLKATTKE